MNSRKRILVFIDWYKPGFKAGGPIQSCANLVEHLSPYFEFYIVTRDTDYCETEPYASVVSNTWNKLNNGEQVYYISQNCLSAATIKKLCNETHCDTAYINGVYSFYFSLLPLYYLKGKKTVKLLVAARGMLAQSAINIKANKKKIFLWFAKKFGFFTRVTFQASTVDEQAAISLALGKETKIVLAENFSKKVKATTLPAKTKEKGTLRLVNIARIAPEKNLLYAISILRHVKSNVIFDFYGPIYDKAYFDKCCELIASLPQNITVTYKQSIESDKVNETLQHYHCLFLPTQGENFGHIILESFTAGCPVIISDKTPWKNLEALNIGFAQSLSNTASFVEAIENMAALNQEQYILWSKSAFDFGVQHTSNPEILKQNLTLFNYKQEHE
ncbi:MAG: glycosyltransferase family 4 protein [Bacteroidetes bacterium]|nr:glycosyltransferase family 4 protein [Bacteroidota bacterium]MBK9800171.1 glycosyltransferase family 4 protein [Bacteroidota bacterium]MBP6412399.1 glycosyltransferase family 4 protein [Bacteroidia bacterium]